MIEREILNLIIEIRKKNITQGDLVRKAGLKSEPYLSRILRGYIWPTDIEIKEICRVLEVSPEYLDFELGDK